MAFGDHQVAPITAQNIARTLRIPIYQPTLAPWVLPDGTEGFWNLQGITKFPYKGSALYYWNAGTLPPPLGNITPVMGPEWIAECTGANAANADSVAVRRPARGSASPARGDRPEEGVLPARRRHQRRLRGRALRVQAG